MQNLISARVGMGRRLSGERGISMTSAAKISQRRNEMRRGLICLLKFIDGDAEDQRLWLHRVKSGRPGRAALCFALSYYSVRNVLAGSIEAARRAGISPAAKAVNARPKTDRASRRASIPCTSKSSARTNRAQRNATGIPIARPRSAWITAPRIIIRVTRERSAPRAIRIPISDLRLAIVYALTP